MVPWYQTNICLSKTLLCFSLLLPKLPSLLSAWFKCNKILNLSKWSQMLFRLSANLATLEAGRSERSLGSAGCRARRSVITCVPPPSFCLSKLPYIYFFQDVGSFNASHLSDGAPLARVQPAHLWEVPPKVQRNHAVTAKASNADALYTLTH